MFNFLDKIRENPDYYRQLSVDEQLITLYDCPLEEQKVDLWSNQHYFVYVVDGKKTWHANGTALELSKGSCIFVREGAHIVEQFFETRFCVVLFFLSEGFIRETIRSVAGMTPCALGRELPPILPVAADDAIHAFFQSVVPYFHQAQQVNNSLLELKFRELILQVVGNPANKDITDFFRSLEADDDTVRFRRILEENFRYNLRLEDYARLSGKSLSSFKRCFEERFGVPPGRWLLERRLQHARTLLVGTRKPVSEIAWESGFESASHFSRAYRQFYGHVPSEQRELTA